MLKVINGVAVWIAGADKSNIDVWFLPGFAESHLCFREAFNQGLCEEFRVILFDPPGFGASPARLEGLTISECAVLWKDLIASVSSSRKVVLIGHSVAGIIATKTAKMLSHPPSLVISIEGNLTKADAYFSGQAASYSSPKMFYRAFSEKVLSLVNSGEVPMSYYASLQFADPKTLWVLGCSALEYDEPGEDFRNLECPTVYYWSKESTSADSALFLSKNNIDQRRMDGLGHWPMNKSPKLFYDQLLLDILKVV